MVTFGTDKTPRGVSPGDRPQWYACYTRARHEKKIEQLLGQRGIDSYLPTVLRIQQWKDRRKAVSFVMFPSYVFARFALDELPRVLSLPGVAEIVRHNGKPAPIPPDELENVRRFAEVAGKLDQEPRVSPLPDAGAPVRIVAGPFRGIEGIVIEHRGRARVLVGLSTIGQGLELDLEAAVLEQFLS